jgi:hypothetical protein
MKIDRAGITVFRDMTFFQPARGVIFFVRPQATVPGRFDGLVDASTCTTPRRLLGVGLIGDEYRVKDVLGQCARLQRWEARWENLGVSELMRMAVMGEPSEDTAIVLCRLLFRGRDGGALRRPMRGEPGFLGDTSCADWPLEPVHLFQSVPFCIVSMYSLAGLPELPPGYLAYCLRAGAWNPDPYPEMSEMDLKAIAHDFIARGPWARTLASFEQQMLLAQIT